MSNDPMRKLTQKARSSGKKRVVFPEATADNILLAAREALELGVAEPILVGDPEEIAAAASAFKVPIEGLRIADINDQATQERYVEYQTRTCGALPQDALRYVLTQPLYYAAMMVRAGDADAMVAGYVHATGEVILAGQLIIGLEKGIATPSSIFLMDIPGWQGSEGSQIIFADCAICPDPNPEQLADIAVSSARTAQDLLGWEPRVAMLSFSTRGSTEHDQVDLVRKATQLVKERWPELAVDGEMQADAAIVPEIGAKKHPMAAPWRARPIF